MNARNIHPGILCKKRSSDWNYLFTQEKVMQKLLMVTMATALLAGCGGNVKEVSCAGKDWYALGYETAIKGQNVRSFDAYRSQCGQNLEAGALDTYVSGYTKG